MNADDKDVKRFTDAMASNFVTTDLRYAGDMLLAAYARLRRENAELKETNTNIRIAMRTIIKESQRKML